MYPLVKKDQSGAKEEVKRNTFTYLASLWIVILAFAVPAVVFMLWKGTQKSKEVVDKH